MPGKATRALPFILMAFFSVLGKSLFRIPVRAGRIQTEKQTAQAILKIVDGFRIEGDSMSLGRGC